ncbi:MAG: aminotransferase class III-fold pyridoxal phosphate-dependent enzyme [bacterium]|nr:aminotransferase class III-fold pyridoxal phosphate-dependent enzyme [Acidimicrobiia bacterium]MCY4651476.1 aminotransferase class III-fold pyridoxal phosphate-dependent enzyme [bacterium]
MKHHRSAEYYHRAREALAGGVSSQFRSFEYPHPLFYESGRGSRITDVDGNTYLDFTLSQGPLILGHSHPEVGDAVAQATSSGQIFAGQHLAELELAETIGRLVPCADLVRFSLSGSEAVHAALRAARVHTGRTRFLKFEGHYHGWFDNVAVSVSAPSADALGSRVQPRPLPWTAGRPSSSDAEVVTACWNDLEGVERALASDPDGIAAVITEPVMCNSGCIMPSDGFLEGLRSLCDFYGAVLIFDEVITGFRLGMSGAQGFFGVVPDLATFGKAMANGFPISALAGKAELMNHIARGTALHAGTMNAGNPTVAAAVATLKILERDRVHERLFRLGSELAEGLRRVSAEAGHPLRVEGPGPMIHTGFTDVEQIKDYRDALSYDGAKFARFVAGMHRRGIRLIGRGLWYLSAVHTEADIEEAVTAAAKVLAAI